MRVLPCIPTGSPQTVELAVHNDGLSSILELSNRSVIFGRMDRWLLVSVDAQILVDVYIGGYTVESM